MKKMYSYLIIACVFALMTPAGAVTIIPTTNGADSLSASNDSVITAQTDKSLKIAAKKTTTKINKPAKAR